MEFMIGKCYDLHQPKGCFYVLIQIHQWASLDWQAFFLNLGSKYYLIFLCEYCEKGYNHNIVRVMVYNI
jgi:hypothetical protein